MYDFMQPQGPMSPSQPLPGQTPMPPKKPSLGESLLSNLFPAGELGDVIPADVLANERRMALRKAGLSLMAAGGSRLQGTQNTGADLYNAFNPDSWDAHLSQVAETSVKLAAIHKKAADEAKSQAIVAKYPAAPNETPEAQELRLGMIANEALRNDLPELAQLAAKLKGELRGPALMSAEPGHPLVNPQSGTVVATMPKALTTVEGSQLYSQALSRLAPWERLGSTVAQYRQFRNLPLTQPNSAALISAAQELLSTHSNLVANEPDMKGLEHLPVAGQLFRVLQSLGGAQTLTEPQRKELTAAVDAVVSRLSKEGKRVRGDVERILRNKFSQDDIKNLLPAPTDLGGKPGIIGQMEAEF